MSNEKQYMNVLGITLGENGQVVLNDEQLKLLESMATVSTSAGDGTNNTAASCGGSNDICRNTAECGGSTNGTCVNGSYKYNCKDVGSV